MVLKIFTILNLIKCLGFPFFKVRFLRFFEIFGKVYNIFSSETPLVCTCRNIMHDTSF